MMDREMYEAAKRIESKAADESQQQLLHVSVSLELD